MKLTAQTASQLPLPVLTASNLHSALHVTLTCTQWCAGEPMIIKKAVCMHEEDYGTLWKHTEYRTGHSEVRRSRRLVLSFIAR